MGIDVGSGVDFGTGLLMSCSPIAVKENDNEEMRSLVLARDAPQFSSIHSRQRCIAKQFPVRDARDSLSSCSGWPLRSTKKGDERTPIFAKCDKSLQLSPRRGYANQLHRAV